MFGQRLRRLREGRNLSQDEMAERIGKTRRTVGRWERGETSPSLDDLLVISGALGIDVGVLAGHAPSDHGLTGDVTPAQVQSVSTAADGSTHDEAPADAGERLTAGARHTGG